MTLRIAAPALHRLRRYFDETMYAMVDFRLSFEAPVSPTGFPRYQQLQAVVARLDGAHRSLFRLFRLGEAVEADEVERTMPADVLAALQRCGLLLRQDGGWRTPSLLLIPLDGLFVFVSVPPSYPTATAPCAVWFDLSSHVFAKALPAALHAERVLDICSGSGVLSLLSAKRGAASVTGLELNPAAVELARLNAAFNGLGDRSEFRLSDKLAALQPDERFDFVLCNTPYAPVGNGRDAPASLDAIGNRILIDLIDALPQHLTPRGHGIVALWRSIGSRTDNAQRARINSRFRDAGLRSHAFVDQAQDGIDGMLKILRADVELRHGAAAGAANEATARALLEAAGSTVTGCYNQLIFFASGAAPETADPAIFGLADVAAGGR